MSARICYRNFTGGEIAPTLSARYDLSRYATSVQCMENMLPNLHGDTERRSGFRFLSELGGEAALYPFSFNADEENNFILVFSEGLLRIATPSGGLIDGLSLVSPYASSDMFELSTAQSGDVVYIAHPSYPLHKLTRSGTAPNYEWTLSSVVLNTSLSAPSSVSAVFVRNNSGDTASLSYPLRYKITSVDANGVESLPSEAGECEGKHPSDWVVGNHVDITWQAAPDAVEYNIYREEAGYFGFIGISKTTSFTDSNYEADISDTPKSDWNPFANNVHPSTVAFHEQRLAIGGTSKEPQVLIMSRTGDFESFRKSSPLQDDDPVEMMLASGSIDEICWMTGFGELLVGTSGAEYKISGSDGVIKPSDCRSISQSFWGSGRLAPITVGNSILHCQRGGSCVRDLFYSLERDGYSGSDLSVLVPHLFEGHRIRQWAYQQTPGSRIWCVRDDGMMLCLTYMKEQDICGWSRHTTQGQFISVASVSGGTNDIVLCVVKRTIGGVEKYYLERMEDRFTAETPLEDAFFVDSGATRISESATQSVSGLEHLEGQTVSVLADGAPVEGLTVSEGTVELPFSAFKIHVGLPYDSILSPSPVETDANRGSTLGKVRGFGACVVRLYRSVGGSYGADREHIDYDLPFLPESYGEACKPFTGDIEFYPPSGRTSNSGVWLCQSRPLPMRIVALMCDVDFGEA